MFHPPPRQPHPRGVISHGYSVPARMSRSAARCEHPPQRSCPSPVHCIRTIANHCPPPLEGAGGGAECAGWRGCFRQKGFFSEMMKQGRGDPRTPFPVTRERPGGGGDPAGVVFSNPLARRDRGGGYSTPLPGEPHRYTARGGRRHRLGGSPVEILSLSRARLSGRFATDAPGGGGDSAREVSGDTRATGAGNVPFPSPSAPPPTGAIPHRYTAREQTTSLPST